MLPLSMRAIQSVEIQRITSSETTAKPDLVVVEEPLEIRVGYGPADNRQQKSLSVTMRTPTGHDFELALGFLVSEGIVQSASQILSLRYCTDAGRQAQENTVRVELQPNVPFDVEQLSRHFYATSSCGVCGKASIEAIEQMNCPVLPPRNFQLTNEQIFGLTAQLAQSQLFFTHTGGLHAAALFDKNATLQLVREDIGRHNALDKLIGAAFLKNELPLAESVLLMSSRGSFELVQKALVAGIPVLVCVGAPSSLAVQLAQQFGLTLIGFLRENSFNVYSSGN